MNSVQKTNKSALTVDGGSQKRFARSGVQKGNPYSLDGLKGSVWTAARDGDFERLEHEIFVRGFSVGEQDEDGCTPLHYAVRHSQLPTAKWLCEHGAQINVCDKFGCTPLHFAAGFSSAETVRWLLEDMSANNFVENDSGVLAADLAAALARDENEKILRSWIPPGGVIEAKKNAKKIRHPSHRRKTALDDVPDTDELFLQAKALKATELSLGEFNEALIPKLKRIASLQFDHRQFEKAVDCLLRAVDIGKRCYGARDARTAELFCRLAHMYNRVSDLSAAESCLREALSIAAESLGEEHQQTAVACHNLALILVKRGIDQEASRLFLREIAIYEKGDCPRLLTDAFDHLSALYRRQGEIDRSEELASRSLEAMELAEERMAGCPEEGEEKINPAEAVWLIGSQATALKARRLEALAEARCLQRKFASAQALMRRCLALRQKLASAGELPVEVLLRTQNNLAAVPISKKKSAEQSPSL